MRRLGTNTALTTPIVLLAALVMLLSSTGTAYSAQRPAGRAPARGECLTIRSEVLGRSVAYCALLPESYDTDKTRRYPVLYFLHGLGDNEQMFLNSGGWSIVQDLWSRRELGEFLIVTPAGGATFYINSHDGRVRYEDFLLREFFPAIERKYRIQSGRGSRGVAGISMGGYGALRLAFKHPNLFRSVSAQSAMLIEKLPAVAAGNSPLSGRMQMFGSAFGSPVKPEFWDANSPLVLARTANLSGLQIYVDCGSEDSYGFYAGAKALHASLLSRNIGHEFHLDPGGHNWVYFASHLPAVLKFHSRAFGAAAKTTVVAN